MSSSARASPTTSCRAAGEHPQQVGAELPAGAGDQDSGVTPSAARAFSGSHQSRLSRYQATVSARPSSNAYRGR